ncbi:MAG: hypothetical protein ABFD90_01320 [Phycisphaerales bacterium]
MAEKSSAIIDDGLDNPSIREKRKPVRAEVCLCKAWILEWIDKRKTINLKYTSYYLKHAVEAFSSTYVSNGAFIQAAMESGFNVKPVEVNSVNAYFNMSFKRFEKHRDEKGIPI